MIKYYSFGQEHVHKLLTMRGEILIDKNMLVKVDSPNPRQVMVRLFEGKWDADYDSLPDMKYFPRGIYDVTTYRWVGK